ncbi:ecotropic viral integration site [Perkinsus olseni]|uniref:Ecotropic viral integration site n=1 Tax=Perkinsus olseni TaxID=32597 RepID=A0A7J6LHG7_PEROL|nr:ecotropic viral integration site [Perkinsus olseni]
MSSSPRAGGGLYRPRGHHRKRWPVAVDGRGHRYRIPAGKGANDGSSVTSPTLSSTTQENPYSSSSSSKYCSLPEPPETVTDHASTSSSSVSRTPCASGSVVDTSTSLGPLSSVSARALTLAIPRGYLSIKDVVKCSELVCSRWRSFGQRKWLKLAVCHCSVEDGEERRWFWMNYCGRVRELPLLREFDGDIRKCYDYYVHAGVDEYSELEHEIARDVRRTLPTHELFVRDQGGIHEKLKNVLIAVANANPTVGYCQGMNFIAAVLLLHLGLDPANAFIMMQCLLDNYHYRYLFSPGVPLLPLRMRQFSCVARKNLPALWHHLNSHSFTMDVFSQQWVMTLFGYYVDADFLKYVYDLFFLCGWKAVFKTGMAILAALEPKILKMNMEEISRYMQNSKHGTDFMRAEDDTGRRLAQERAMLKILNGCKVTNRDLIEYAGEFQTARLLEAIKNIPASLLESSDVEPVEQHDDLSSSSRSLRERLSDGISTIQGAIMRRPGTNGETGSHLSVGGGNEKQTDDDEARVDSPIALGVIGFSVEPPGDLVIDTNALITKNKPLWREGRPSRDSPGSSSLRVPLRQVCELKHAIKARNDQLGQDMAALTTRLSNFETQKLLPAEKHRDDLAIFRDRALARYRMLQQRKLVLSAKLQERARESVTPESPPPVISAADLSPFSRTTPVANLTQRRDSADFIISRRESLDDMALLGVPPSPTSLRYRDSSTVDDVKEGEPLQRTLERVIQVERECHTAKEALSQRSKEYAAALNECRELEEVKKRYVQQTTQFMSDMEVTIQELVWSTIGGSAYRPRQSSPRRH